ncbi:hypothetical protein GH714_041039 [Hevea brasiliensis]|uniref:SLH domain-containing protein n=1 Tax=Hevea brasiliensis TaxID=3981 RepID=A0A6A6N9E3_HEVBR|nr:hypothetical protein GH714_041039 [Hevea brasiliensis]
MCSSATSPPSCLFLRTTSTRPLLGSRCLSPYSFFRSNNPRILRLSASVADSHLDLSWFSPGHSSNDDGYNGWAVVEAPPRSCFPTILLGGGTCVAALVAAIAYFSLSRKGFKLQFHSPFRALHGMMSPIDSKADKIEAKNLSIGDSDENAVVAEGSLGFMPEENGETITSVSAQKLERVKVSVPVDSTQLEALSVLKKLKIIEDDVRAEELCTRREYARWNPKHRLVPSMLLSGSVVAAFDDVNVEDSDFDSIQALAEAGIIHSKLSGTNCGSDSSNGDLSFFFYPDRFISRQDLINWKAQLEYRFMPEMTEQEKTLAEHLKEKATMDCQRQLLLGLKDEVDEMSERLTSERSMYVAEQCKLQELLSELQTKQEGMLDKKSIAEAETEALRILRSWVEDEARKSQARVKSEEVGRRWKWDNQA